MKRKDKKMSTFQIFEDFAKLEVRSEEIDILGEKSLIYYRTVRTDSTPFPNPR